MKKSLVFLSLILAIAVSAEPNVSFAAQADSPRYALIGDDAMFFTLKNDEFSPLFTLPSGYFVRLTGEENGDRLEANYLDLTGYVLRADVEKVDYTPRTKYAETNSLTIIGDGHAVNLRSLPDHTAKNVLTEIADGTETYYYGTQTGSAQVSAVGNDWYYVRTNVNGTFVRGYVYSLYADAKPVPVNVIEREPEETADPPAEQTETQSGYSARDEIIIVVSLCVPTIVVMYLLFQPQKSRKKDEN